MRFLATLLFLALLVLGVWTFMDADKHGWWLPPIAEVYASQFDWRIRYAGQDGKFGTADDIENPFEFVVPANEKVRFILRSRDVIHSFFVPYFRLKQDAVPGMAIPVWFEATQEG